MTRAAPRAVELSGLTKSFGDVRAVDDVSAVAAAGRGHGLARAQRGRQDHHPADAARDSWRRPAAPRRSAAGGTTSCPTRSVRSARSSRRPAATPGVPRSTTCASSRPRRGCPRTRPMRVLAETGLAADARRRVGEFSLGMRQRLGLAAAMLGDPAVLVLDEPTNGLDPPGVRWLRGYVRRLADEGRTVLVSSHALSEVEQTADHVLVLANGRLLRSSSLAALRAEAGVGSRVRTPDPDRLSAALDAAGHSYRRRSEDSPSTPPPSRWGNSRRRTESCCTPRPRPADLEQAFFRLIEQSGHGRAAGVARGGASVKALVHAEVLKLRSTRTTAWAAARDAWPGGADGRVQRPEGRRQERAGVARRPRVCWPASSASASACPRCWWCCSACSPSRRSSATARSRRRTWASRAARASSSRSGWRWPSPASSSPLATLVLVGDRQHRADPLAGTAT